MDLEDKATRMGGELKKARADLASGAERRRRLEAHIRELEAELLAEAEARFALGREGSVREDQLQARITTLEAKREEVESAQAEIIRLRAIHDIAMDGARETARAARESSRIDSERAIQADAEAARLRAEHTASFAAKAMAVEEAAEAARAKEAAERAAAAAAERAAAAEVRAEALASETGEFDGARRKAEVRAEAAEAGMRDAQRALAALAQGRTSIRAELETTINLLSSKLSEAERRAEAAETTLATDSGRIEAKQEESAGLLAASEEARRQCAAAEELAASSRARERELDAQLTSTRAELAAQTEKASAAELGRSHANEERIAALGRLSAMLEKERDAREGVEARLSEALVARAVETKASSRKERQANEALDRLAALVQSDATARFQRMLRVRGRERARSALGRWYCAACALGAATYARMQEERERKRLLQQAADFESRLEKLSREELNPQPVPARPAYPFSPGSAARPAPVRRK
jgi:hypothetical protein